MSRSEQLHDASMEEILASIRKIITDDEPDQPSADAFSASAIDEFREASAALARNRPSGGYMHDLTRALAGDAPVAAADDDIFDDGRSDRAHSAAERGLEDELDAASAALEPPPSDDDDLFEAEPAPVTEPAPESIAVASEDDEEIVEDLGDPIMLGPEIELVEDEPEVQAAVAPVEPEAARETAAPELDISTSVAPEPAAPIAEAIVSPPVIEEPVAAAPPPPPPPPVVSAIFEEAVAAAADVASETVADVSEPASDAIADVVASVVAEAPALDPSPVAEAASDAIAEAAAEAIAEPELPVTEAMAEPAAEVVTEIAVEQVTQSLEAKAAALVEEIVAPVTEVVVAAEVAAPETSEAELRAKSDVAVDQATPPPAPLVPDDMMAAMLKPMLKEWLDANMPRIVAKAMGEKDGAASPES